MLENTDQTDLPIIMVVANDTRLLKLLDMALKLELACQVLTFTSERSAAETAKSVHPDLLILDRQFLGSKASDLSDKLHNIQGMEHVPILFLNAGHDAHNGHKDYRSLFMPTPWKMEELYTGVKDLLDLQ